MGFSQRWVVFYCNHYHKDGREVLVLLEPALVRERSGQLVDDFEVDQDML